MYKSPSMFGYCEPWPGKTNAVLPVTRVFSSKSKYTPPRVCIRIRFPARDFRRRGFQFFAEIFQTPETIANRQFLTSRCGQRFRETGQREIRASLSAIRRFRLRVLASSSSGISREDDDFSRPRVSGKLLVHGSRILLEHDVGVDSAKTKAIYSRASAVALRQG